MRASLTSAGAGATPRRADRAGADPGAARAMNGGRERLRRRQVDGVLLLRQAAGLTSNAALQAVAAAVPRREGRTHRHARSARHRPAAGPVRRGDQVRRASCSMRTRLTRRTIALGATHHDRRCRRGGARAPSGDVRPARSGARRSPRFRGRDRAGAADVLRAQARRPAAVRVRPRRARSVERAARPITIHELTLDALAGASLSVTVRCSKGTYIRVLAEDIGAGAGLRRAPRGAPAARDRPVLGSPAR